MSRGAWVGIVGLTLAACKPADEARGTVIAGAVLIDGAGGPPVSDSVVVVSGSRIAAVGRRSMVPIPAGADFVNGAGKYLVPALVDVAGGQSGMRRISTEAEMRTAVDGGASLLIGMVGDTAELDSALLTRMRNLRVVVAPALRQPVSSTAARNTAEMFRAGVPIGLAAEGGDAIGQAELMAAAGVPPLDVIVAATRNSAMALGQLEKRGTIEAGKQADLLLLTANPGEDIANLRRVALRMAEGAWIR